MSSYDCIDIPILNIGRPLGVGNPDLLHAARAAILNSRQGKFPNCSAPWINATLEATREFVQSGSIIVSSVGMFTWELVTWKVAACGGRLVVVVPGVPRRNIPETANKIARDFNLNTARTLFIFPEAKPQTPEPVDNLPERDSWIVALADTLVPVSIRLGGNLAMIIERARSTQQNVDDRFTVSYKRAARRSFRPKLAAAASESEKLPWGYLTHWTTSTADPWPGETKAEFYAAFEHGEQGYPRSAFHTLSRILAEHCLRASKRLIRGEERLVSLTECPPSELARLAKWRPSLVRWTFEPYGIALDRRKLESLGARPVIYGDDYQYELLNDDDKPFFQNAGHGENDWRVEEEWRLRGDLDLSLFRRDDGLVLVFTKQEADALQKDSPFPVLCWNDIPERLGV
jgi:hypothetical protein